uniref:Uncharacterized protein n=1 Tax=Arundo donax TaxID=35708 RepID=A0A0A9FSM3_ARUDO
MQLHRSWLYYSSSMYVHYSTNLFIYPLILIHY